MKYIKKFENNNIEYSIGDIVACVDPDFDKVGTKYKIIEIFTYGGVNDIDDLPDKVDLEYITSDQIFNYKYFVTVENMAKNNTYHGIYAIRFRSLENSDIIISSNKYNL